MSSKTGKININKIKNLILQGTTYEDYLQILKKIHSYSSGKLETLESKKVLILGTATTRNVKEILEAVFLSAGLRPIIKELEYDAFQLEPLKQNNEFEKFDPEYVYITASPYRILNFPRIGASQKECNQCIQNEFTFWKKRWQAINRQKSRIIFQENFSVPDCFNIDKINEDYNWSPKRIIQEVNKKFQNHENSNFKVIDFYNLSCTHGRSFHDPKWYFHGKINFNPAFSIFLAKEILSNLNDVRGTYLKCLIVDLDNVLWGGEVGDLGEDGIQIGQDSATAMAFEVFQKWLKKLSQTGVYLCVCSKNNLGIVKKAFANNRNMILQLKDFSAFCCNWAPKSENIYKISKKLNINPSSIMFIDDNLSEILEVQSNLPEVTSYHLAGDPAYFPRSINDLKLFLTKKRTQDDFLRNKSIKVFQKLSQNKKTGSKRFLQDLKMKAHIQYAHKNHCDRIEQLFRKTNQFNLTQKTFSENELSAIIKNKKEKICLTADLKDISGYHGLISAAVIQIHHENAEILNWVLSCRAFSRTLEEKFLNETVSFLKEKKVQSLIINFNPNEKNLYAHQKIANMVGGFDKNYSAKIIIKNYLNLATYIS